MQSLYPLQVFNVGKLLIALGYFKLRHCLASTLTIRYKRIRKSYMIDKVGNDIMIAKAGRQKVSISELNPVALVTDNSNSKHGNNCCAQDTKRALVYPVERESILTDYK